MRTLLMCLAAAVLFTGSSGCSKKGKPPTAPVTEYGSITVASEPSGASIWLDGASTNRTTSDTLLKVPTGTHVILLTLSGYRSWRDTVLVRTSLTTSVNARLARTMTGFTVSTDPTGAKIFLDGQDTQLVTPDTVETTAGAHAVLVRKDGFYDGEWRRSVAEDELIELTVRLTPRCPGAIVGNLNEAPAIRITVAEPARIRGDARNIDARRIRVVLWALTNYWYVQPYIDSPYTTICGDGSWSNYTHPWNRIVALLVDETYVPGATRTFHPKNDPGVLAWAEYPSLRNDLPLQFSSRTWDIKVAESPFGPGPNYFSDHPDNVFVDQTGRLHLKIVYRDGKWYCSEVLLPQSLGFGVYTVQIDSRLDGLDQYLVVAPVFTFESGTRELDFEAGGDVLIPGANNGQFVVQPYTRAGNLVRFVMPAEAQTSCRIEWRADHVQFTVWKGHGSFPQAPEDVIYDWTYTGPDIPPPGGERLHANIWLFNGQAPANGEGAELILRSFTFQP
ncbi:MAG: PEGA domain-containing protein [Candidatus Kerfeldbacteria bacterium]|nr:PEGA domain-containing protein [Candidatus Kerfeldbacteria bacterium]